MPEVNPDQDSAQNPTPAASRQLTPVNPTAESDARVLLERARLLALPPANTSEPVDLVEVVAFHSGNNHFGIPTTMVREIQSLRALQWSPVPCAPPFIVGLINLRGHLYSIMDLSRYLNHPPQPIAENAYILLVIGGTCEDGGTMELTLLADDMPTIERGPASRLYPPPATLSQKLQDYVRGVTADRLVILDLERLLSDPQIVVNENI